MYNKFYGFKEKPFKLVPNPTYLFLSKSHEEALAHLTYAITQGDGFVEITGEVGTGKTTLCRVFLESLDESIEAAYIFNPKLDALQLLKAINDEFGIDSSPDNTKDLIDRLNTFLIEIKSAGKKALVLIDEAQNLSREVLEQLRLLSNLETTQEKLLQIILVGQPELGDMLSSHQLRQLGQRITINCQLTPLTFQETKDYIRHRIALASHRAGPPFDNAAYRAIYAYSQGVPRLINIACDRVLLNGFSRNSFNITGPITKEAIAELIRKKTRSTFPADRRQSPIGVLVVCALFISLALLLLFTLNKEPALPPVSMKTPAIQPTPAVIEDTAAKTVRIPEDAGQPNAETPSQTAETDKDQEPSLQPGLTDEPDSGEKLSALPEVIAQQQPEKTVSEARQPADDSQNFLNYLRGLNSRYSRNSSMEAILHLWFPQKEIVTDETGISTDRFFFQETAGHYDLQVQPVATETDLALIRNLNLPTVFTFYLVGHAWPKYLAITGIEPEKIYYFDAGQNKPVSVDKDIFLQYWSGEAYVFWKDFNELDQMIRLNSRGQNVKKLKVLLQQLGYDTIVPTDVYDQNTMQVIMDIQTKYGLRADGLVGALTKIALYNESQKFLKPSLVKFEAASRENGS